MKTNQTIESDLKLNEEVEQEKVVLEEEIKAESPSRVDFEREVPIVETAPPVVLEEEQEEENEEEKALNEKTELLLQNVIKRKRQERKTEKQPV